MNYKKAFLALVFCCFTVSSSYAMKLPKSSKNCLKDLVIRLIEMGNIGGDSYGVSTKALSAAFHLAKYQPNQFNKLVEYCDAKDKFAPEDIKLVQNIALFNDVNNENSSYYDRLDIVRAIILLRILENKDCDECKESGEQEYVKYFLESDCDI